MLDQSRYQMIAIDVSPATGVALATLNRPEKLNAANAEMYEELTTLSLDADSDRRVRALVITGAGRAFCVGGDVSGPMDNGPGGLIWKQARRVIDNLLSCEKPVISAVNGYALGFGASVALFADVVFAARSAVFADTHVSVGLGAGDGGQIIWPLLMGVNRAKYHLMTGSRIDAVEAERLGLVNFVVEDDLVLSAAVELAERLANGPSRAIAAAKMPLNNYLRSLVNQIMPLSLAHEEATMYSGDHREAVAAFRERRAPKFTGE